VVDELNAHILEDIELLDPVVTLGVGMVRDLEAGSRLTIVIEDLHDSGVEVLLNLSKEHLSGTGWFVPVGRTGALTLCVFVPLARVKSTGTLGLQQDGAHQRKQSNHFTTKHSCRR
jgi:hypothetical protein